MDTDECLGQRIRNIYARISWANDRDRLSLARSLQTGLHARILVTCIKKIQNLQRFSLPPIQKTAARETTNVLDVRKVIWKLSKASQLGLRLKSNTWCRTCKEAEIVLWLTVRGSRLERRAEEANWSQLAIRWNWVSNNVLLVFSVTPFKIDQNKNQSRSIDKVQNLGNERR